MSLRGPQIKAISELVHSTPRYIVFMGYRLAIEIAIGRRLTIKEQRRLYSSLQHKEFKQIEEEIKNDHNAADQN